MECENQKLDTCQEYHGMRLIALFGCRGLFFKLTDQAGCLELVDVNQIQDDGKFRILLDAFVEPDWGMLATLSHNPNAEIRHLSSLSGSVKVSFGKQDYDNFWNRAESITGEKMDYMYDLVHCQNDFFSAAMLEHTYFLILPSKSDSDGTMEKIPRSVFSGALNVDGADVSLAYIAGVEIPKDAELIIVYFMDEQLVCFEYSWMFRVFGGKPLCEKDAVVNSYCPKQGFSIVRGWNQKQSILDTYSLCPERCSSENVYMAIEFFDVYKRSRERVEKELMEKFFKDDIFRKACENPFFMKWDEVKKV